MYKDFDDIASYYDDLYVKEPDYAREAARVVDAVDRPGTKIARMEQIRLKAPDLVEVTFHHLVGTAGEVAYHQQAVAIGLFSRETYRSAMADAGLEVVEEVAEGDIRGGALIGRRR